MSSPSNVTLSIAALQNRKRTQMLVGFAILAVLVLIAGGLFLYAPATPHVPPVHQEPSKPQQLPVESSASYAGLSDQPVGFDPEYRVQPEVDTLLELLKDDTVHGELVRQIHRYLGAKQIPPIETIDRLNLVAREKVSSIDTALSQAMYANNAALVEKLSGSKFFLNYGIGLLPQWGWVSTPALDKYKLATSSLANAEATGDQSSVLSALESIREITGYAGHDAKINGLRRRFADQYEEKVKLTIVSHMESGDYDLALQTAKKHAPLVSKNASLQDLVRQASAAKENSLRDDAVGMAAELARRDDWESAVRAAKSIPAGLRAADVDEIIYRGEKIISAHKTLSSLALRPDRLTDSNVEQYARKQIASASELMLLSPSLNTAANKLSNLLDEASGTLSVTIMSDNRATILIPGLGYIEPMRQKVLDLQRTKYKFIIRCENKRDTFEYLDLRETPIEESPTIRLMCET